MASLLKMNRALKFSANISSLFLDIPDHIESYQEILNRKDYRFQAVEAQDPYKNSLEEWHKKLDGVKELKPEFVLINSPALFDKYAKRLPTVEEFDTVLSTLSDYVQALQVRKVHLMLADIREASEMEQIKQLLRRGAQHLATLDVTCLIEPLSMRPHYYLRSYDLALELVKELNEPNLKIMFDTYHCQRLHGNILHNLQQLKDYIGHVQISQVPQRDCPIDEGELNHDFILHKLPDFYNDYIGLEYFNYSTDSFEWTKKYSEQVTEI